MRPKNIIPDYSPTIKKSIFGMNQVELVEHLKEVIKQTRSKILSDEDIEQ